MILNCTIPRSDFSCRLRIIRHCPQKDFSFGDFPYFRIQENGSPASEFTYISNIGYIHKGWNLIIAVLYTYLRKAMDRLVRSAYDFYIHQSD